MKEEMKKNIEAIVAITKSHIELKRKRNNSISRTISKETYSKLVAVLNNGTEAIRFTSEDFTIVLGNNYSNLKEENVQSSISAELKKYIAANEIPEAKQLKITGNKIDDETYFWEIRLAKN